MTALDILYIYIAPTTTHSFYMEVVSMFLVMLDLHFIKK